MNILNKVTFKSLLKNKTRTIATIIGIILSAALMCTVMGAVSSFMGTLYDNAIYRAGYWNFCSWEMSPKDYDEIMKAPSIKEVKFSQILGFSNTLEQSESANLKVLGTSGNFEEENMAVHITEGEYPASNKEMLLPLAYSYSADIKIGDKITLDIGDRMLDGENINNWGHEDGEYFEVRETREYTVTGFYEAGIRSAIVNYYDPPALTLADEGMPEEYSYDFYLIYKNPRMYDMPSDEFYYVRISGYPNNTLYEALGRGDTFFVTVLIAAVAVILVGVGSVSLIYNAFSISVSERTKLFGLLSSVGASKRQIRRTVIAEALMVSLVGIPLGVAAGVGIVAGGIEVLTQVFGDVGASLGFDVPFTVHINGWALGAAVVVSLLTVLISAWIPSKRATKISAIEAIHMTTEISDKQIKTSPVTEKLFGLSGVLASKYYKRSKKRYRTTIISLVFSIVLFITISGFSDIFMEAVFYQSYTYGYDVSASIYSGYTFSDDKTADDLLETFENADEVTNAAYTVVPNWYGYHNYFRIANESVSQRAQEKHWLTDYSYYETGTRSDWLYGHSNLVFADDGSFKELLKEYNLDEATFMDPDEPLAVVVDGNRSYDSETGRYITKKLLESDNNVLYGYYYDEDAIQKEYGYWNNEVYDENGECTLQLQMPTMNGSLEVVDKLPVESYVMKTGKVIYDRPYFIDDSYSSLTIIYPISLVEKVYKGFADIEPDKYYFLSDDHTACAKTVENILGPNTYVYDYAGEQQSARNVITAASIVMYIFVIIIALISITNVFNTITTNINLRRREFAMLKSIGMTSNGFNGMMNFECVLYGAKSLLYGLPISLVILAVLNLLMTWGYDMSFRLPWLAIFITIAGVFAAVFVTMMYALNKVKKASPINDLKNENI